MPVCIGSHTEIWGMILGPFRPICLWTLEPTGPFPSMALPRASTTGSNSSSPTGTSTIAPVLITVSPSLISLSFPNTTTPILSASKFRDIHFNLNKTLLFLLLEHFLVHVHGQYCHQYVKYAQSLQDQERHQLQEYALQEERTPQQCQSSEDENERHKVSLQQWRIIPEHFWRPACSAREGKAHCCSDPHRQHPWLLFLKCFFCTHSLETDYMVTFKKLLNCSKVVCGGSSFFKSFSARGIVSFLL